MSQEKNNKQKSKSQCCKSKKQCCASDIKGKIEVPDTRERRDGPGGN